MKIDFLTNEDKDLLIINGDFPIGDATREQAETIINASKGELRQFPLTGVEIQKYNGATIDTQAIINLIKRELLADNIVADIVTVTADADGDIVVGLDLL